MGLTKAREALKAIRRMECRIDNILARREIAARADEIETAIAAFQP